MRRAMLNKRFDQQDQLFNVQDRRLDEGLEKFHQGINSGSEESHVTAGGDPPLKASYIFRNSALNSMRHCLGLRYHHRESRCQGHSIPARGWLTDST